MMFIAVWAGGGVLTGAAFAMQARQLLTTSTACGLPRARGAATPVTGALFGVLAYRFGGHLDLLPYSYLAAVGVAASTVDLIEQRLPTELILPACGVLGALFTTSAIVDADARNLLRALAGAAVLTTFHLALALASRGGLGAGDVKFGGLLGMALGWLGWSAIVTATLLAWATAAMALIFLPALRSRSNAAVPMGPFLLCGTLIAITLPNY
jgi:leader peptidase (prepilin peptidase)/N-methyltransferase